MGENSVKIFKIRGIPPPPVTPPLILLFPHCYKIMDFFIIKLLTYATNFIFDFMSIAIFYA
jgi:hypothetical protein